MTHDNIPAGGDAVTPASPITGGRDVERLSTVDVAAFLDLARHRLGDVSYLFKGIDTLTLWRCRASGVKFFDPMVCGDGRFYDMINAADWYYPGDKYEYAYAARQVAAGQAVLDVGCGAGEFSDYLPEGASFRGVELSEGAIARAQAAGRDVRGQMIEDHAKENAGAYDVVTSFQVIEHVPSPSSFVRSIADCAKPGGKIVIATPNDDSFVGLAINDLLNMPPHHVTRWTPDSLKWVMENNGVTGVSVHAEPLQDVHAEWYAQQLVLRALRNARAQGGMPLVDTRLTTRLASKAARLVAMWLKRGIVDSHPGAPGQCMIAVGTKA